MQNTNVPQPTFGPKGFLIPSESAILAGVQADFAAAFAASGYVLNPALNTPQGQLAVTEAATIGNTDAIFQYYTTQVDPAYATGRMQDAIARIYFLERIPAQATVVQALCSGAAGVVVPTGALAIATDSNIYTCTAGGTISSGGSVTLPFACNAFGPIPCGEGSLNQIYQSIPGWDSITNPTDGVIGNAVESRSAFETRRQASVALNSMGFLASIVGAVLAVPGVLDAYATENDTASPVTVGDFTLAPNSLYVAAAGGSAADIAQAIWSKKAPGCAYNGNTTVRVYDTAAGYVIPYPSYNVSFEIPSSLPILFAVNIANGPQVPFNAVTLVQNAIINAFAGGDGGSRARIAGTLYSSRFIAPVASLGSWVQIISILVGSMNTPAATASAYIAGTNMTVVAVASGTLAPGQNVTDSTGRILPGTIIVSQTSGSTGGTGVYVVSISQSVSGAAFTGTASGANLTASAVTGTINLGDRVEGTGVPSGTTIVSQLSGVAGGAGVYITSVPTTASSNSLMTSETVYAVVANGFDVSAGIDQVPTIAANQIIVTLT